MSITLVQLKEYREHCQKEFDFFSSELEKYCLPEQRDCAKRNKKYYEKELDRMDSKIANYTP